MVNQLNVSPAHILEASEEFSGLRDTAVRIHTDVDAKLPPVEDIAGRDEYGEAFAKQFGSGVESARRLLTEVGSGFDNTGSNLRTTAGLYLKSNDVNVGLGLRLR